jgi:hypothetical protein
MSTTALEVMMKQEHFQKQLAVWTESMRHKFLIPLMDKITRPYRPAIPHTDDMIQMLQDLGIEPKEDWNNITFRWR